MNSTSIARILVLLAAGSVAILVATFGEELWRNRDGLGRAWNCRRFVREVEPNLRALHAAEHAFREKHGRFTSDMAELGFRPEKGEVGSVFYAYGFADASDPRRAVLLDGKSVGFGDVDLPPDTRATEDAFLAGAATEIRPDVGPDVWTIDQDGRITRVRNGCWK